MIFLMSTVSTVKTQKKTLADISIFSCQRRQEQHHRAISKKKLDVKNSYNVHGDDGEKNWLMYQFFVVNNVNGSIRKPSDSAFDVFL